ncbi:DUF1236 domain-containing protein [Rhizobium sp. CECT 9324]|uniref:DUF1236 domain-containing protein n=1 Tax=Rhizobium sp. CECT 9324 TaxID=2845820 RepID=UPI001E52AF10|nr:DUF1236 domain-containing protein [Rhizobium sp. CECT 9324]CAH0340009.1 hypothetical protein RHI9324_01665 [Rhizobium sp. CECT 9324]
MRNRLILSAAATLLTLSASAYAQETVIIQQAPAPAPVMTPAPVMAPQTVVIPGEVRTYVMQQEVQSVPYEGDVLIGRVIDGPVELYPVDGYDGYSYTVVNERRVIVDPQTRAVVQILD